jgi:23S rRNA (adenine2503-C2)-methyltransferase
MQFSLHTTNRVKRDQLIPVSKWDFGKIAHYGENFYREGDRKVTLNFALAEDSPLSAEELFRYFDPEIFIVKLTPVNPTINAKKKQIVNAVTSEAQANELKEVRDLRDRGYEVIISIGELEENKIGSNCGQYVKAFLDDQYELGQDTYQYRVEEV